MTKPFFILPRPDAVKIQKGVIHNSSFKKGLKQIPVTLFVASTKNGLKVIFSPNNNLNTNKYDKTKYILHVGNENDENM